MNNHSALAQSGKNVNRRLGFFIHLTAFLLVNALLIGINLATFSGRYWFQWPLLGWGIGIVAHAATVFWLPRLRDRMVENENGKSNRT